MDTSRVLVYMACSVDGFIAAPGGDISFLERVQKDEEGRLPDVREDSGGIDFMGFMSGIGAMLMGRNTYDVVAGFDIPWPYGEIPVLVATSRALDAEQTQIKAASGDIHALVEAAKCAAGDKDVYLDGGLLVRQALDAGLVDELIITMVPVLLGEGIPLFAGLQDECLLEFTDVTRWNQKCIQWVATPKKR